MRPSLRFLGLFVAGWAGVRAYTMGVIPGVSLVQPSEAKAAPPIVPTEFPPIDAPQPAPATVAYANPPAVTYAQMPQALVAQVRPLIQRIYYGVGSVRAPLPPARPVNLVDISQNGGTPLYAQSAAFDDSPLSRLASQSMAERQSSVVAIAGQSTPVWTDARTNRIDRIQASGWALVRGQQGQPLGPTSLASGGQLGGSQAGGRILYNFTRQIAASIRYSSDIGRRGGEFAAGVRVQPVGGIPVWVTAERRQRLGSLGGGRNDFAIFAEGGVYQRPMPWRFSFDAYLQAGLVGVQTRDFFVDGALAMTRPIYKNFSAGFGLWGGAQRGIYRVDAGPRLTMGVRKNLKVHLDWRQKLAGNAQPSSGPALTLAADF
jgi:hypothetical protein